jgi:hypothetical protein
MGALNERIKLSQLVHGKDLVDYFKNNSQYMYEQYQTTSDLCQSQSIDKISKGGFYFFVYKDDSNWMRYSLLFCTDYRKLNNLTIVMGINFNFIPIEIRGRFFDQFINEKDFEKNSYLPVDFTTIYKELLKIGFEYSLVEWTVPQIVSVHRIHLELLPRFLYSSFPKNKYDPNKLMEIWAAKIKDKQYRHQEVILSKIDEFFDAEKSLQKKETGNKYQYLEKHIQRLQRSYEKYGKF